MNLNDLNCRWEKEHSRYYKTIAQRDLFGDFTLTCVWGGINSRLGSYKTHTFFALNDLIVFFNDIKKRRQKRGYKICANSTAIF